MGPEGLWGACEVGISKTVCLCGGRGGHTMTFPSSGRPKSEKQPPARPPCADGFQGLVGNSARVAIAFLCRVTRTG